jgi:hypothetical protein
VVVVHGVYLALIALDQMKQSFAAVFDVVFVSEEWVF